MRGPLNTGDKYGRLTMVSFLQKGNSKQRVSLFRCDCGTEKAFSEPSVKCGSIKSCGCVGAEKLRKMATTHGGYRSRTYRIWKNMIQRCTNPNAAKYNLYGGRGISVSERWRSFDNFLADMGECPCEMSIDRIQVSGNYEHGNCKWSTSREQGNNTRRNVRWEYNGRSQTISQWARELKIDPSTLRRRVVRSGMSIEKALNLPIGR